VRSTWLAKQPRCGAEHPVGVCLGWCKTAFLHRLNSLGVVRSTRLAKQPRCGAEHPVGVCLGWCKTAFLHLLNSLGVVRSTRLASASVGAKTKFLHRLNSASVHGKHGVCCLPASHSDVVQLGLDRRSNAGGRCFTGRWARPERLFAHEVLSTPTSWGATWAVGGHLGCWRVVW
jgi:hypothetical protein